MKDTSDTYDKYMCTSHTNTHTHPHQLVECSISYHILAIVYIYKCIRKYIYTNINTLINYVLLLM